MKYIVKRTYQMKPVILSVEVEAETAGQAAELAAENLDSQEMEAGSTPLCDYLAQEEVEEN